MPAVALTPARTACRATGPSTIELDLTIGDHTVVVQTGYHRQAGSQ